MFSRLENKKITSKKNTFSPDGFVVEEKMKRILVHFESWPTNFLAFISQQVQNHGKTPKQLLFENPLSESSKLKKVRLAIASSRHLWRRQNHGEVAPKMLSKKSSTDFVDRAYLIKHTGCTNDVANFWIEKGWLGSVNKIYGPNGGVRYKLPKLAVQKAINICFSTAFPKELADQIQIEESSLRSLVLANVLTPIKYGRSRQNYRLEPKEVFELVGHIFRAAMHIEKSSTCLVSFDKAISMLSTRSPRLVVNFIHDIKYGYLIAVKSEQEPIGIHQISIERAHLLTWIRGYFI
jgi:hypothetical protein